MDTVFPSKNSVKAIRHHPSNQQLKESFQTIVPFFLTLFNLEQSKNPKQTPVTLSLQVKMLCTQCNFNNFMNQNYKPETFKAL